MGYAASRNPRSRQGADPDTGRPKTAAYCALHRLWRAVDFHQGDRVAFELWMDRTMVTPAQRARLEFLWEKRYPKPLVTIEREMPSASVGSLRLVPRNESV